jgi:adenylate kinase
MSQAEQEASSGKGYNESEIKKKLAEYREANCKEDGTPSLSDFFKERGLEPLAINIEEKPKEVILQQMKVYTERSGKPKNYMTEDEDKEQIRQENVKKHQELLAQKKEIEKQEEEKTEKSYIVQKESIDAKRIEKYLEQERQLLELKAQPLKDAIMENIGGILTDGIAEVCEKMPEDPVEYLVYSFTY